MDDLEKLVLRRAVPIDLGHVDIGILGEGVAELYLKRKMYRVFKLEDARALIYLLISEGKLSWRLVGHKPDPGIGQSLRDFLGEQKYAEFLEFWLEVVEKYEVGLDSSARKGSVLPDFLARRGEDFFVVEVKTNKSYLGKEQLDVLRMSIKYGFIPFALKVSLKMALRTFADKTLGSVQTSLP